ncbi:MAG: lysostaphin resistance A-like protein [Terriglobia bacterium]
MATPEGVQRGIVTYLVLTFALSSVFYFFIISSGMLRAAAGLYVLGLMWCPGIAALLTRLLFQRNLGGCGWGWGKTRYQLLSYALPLGYAGVVYLPVWSLGLGDLNLEITSRVAAQVGFGPLSQGLTVILFLLIAGTLGMVNSCMSALGEEIGWRGFLVPELAKVTTFSKTALISGAIWSIWHYPVILFADYRAATPTWYALICFTVMVLGISFPFAWLRLKSGSLWTGMFLHASHNLFIQGVFDQLTRDTGVTKWIIGEFGAGLALVAVLVGIAFWKKGMKLEL